MSDKTTPSHTPGPWTVYAGKLRPQFSTFIYEVQDANGIAVVKWGGFDGAEQPKKVVAANARLIAAAPELLAAAVKHLAAMEEEASANMALDNAESNFSNPMPERRRAAIAMVAASTAEKQLRAAIDKATEQS